jgi:transposase
MAGEIAAAGIMAGAQVGGGLLGMIGQRKREERSFAHTKELMELQQQHQKELDEYGQQLQMKTWQETSYPAQVAMLKEAGLNPALLYGNGGSGGVTGSQGGGNAASGSAPQPQPMPNFMDVAQSLATAAEIALKRAQVKREEEEARKAGAEADKISGVDTEEARSRINVNNGIIQLNLSQEELNDASKAVKQKETDVQQSIIDLNKALEKLNNQKEKEALSQTNLNQADLDWMDEHGINRNDSVLTKSLKYLSEQTNISEENLIYIIGGAIGVRELGNLISKFIFKLKAPTKPGEILNAPTVKGFGK